MPYTPDHRRFALSDRVQLGLGSLAVVTYLGLIGCDSTPPTFEDAHFTTVTECLRAGFPDRLCDKSYNAAWANYLVTAPQFNSLESCEAEWGQWRCMERDAVPTAAPGPSAASVFVPLIAGFAVSKAAQQRYYNGDDEDEGQGSGGSSSGARFYYSGRSGSPIYRTRGGQMVEITAPAANGAKPVARAVNVDSVTVARGGFGGAGRSRGFGG